MKTQLILAAVVFAGTAAAQTGLISHKSHSGAAATYAAINPGNFGLPPVRLQKVTWVNDTTVVTTKGRLSDEMERDTIYNHPVFSDPNMPLDTLKNLYHGGVEFENFDKKEVKTVPEQPEQQEMNTQPSNNTPARENEPAVTGSKKKKNNLFWLWIFGGGTFTGILLVSRKRKPGVAHA